MCVEISGNLRKIWFSSNFFSGLNNLDNFLLFTLIIIEAREKVEGKPNFTQIARDFNTHRTTIGKIAKDRDIFKSRQTLETQSPTAKKFRPFKHENVDEALHMWLKQKSKQDARINLPCLKTKATQLAQEFGEQFEPSDSWLNRFKSRHNLKFKKEQGEKQHNDSEAESLFREGQLKEILQHYEHAQHRV